ncbi:MAG TPA: hypothetical protein VK809_08150 [Bacteroidia bacterium]|nr:hypothetical protein [Bacteroidia bacterium]
MKKTIYILLSATVILNACHPTPKSDAVTNNSTTVDTSKIHAAPQQAADTSIKDGVLFKRYPKGTIKEKSYYAAGRRQGECQSFYENGKLWSDDFFTAGVLDGPTASYYENGQKRYEGSYVKGKPTGTWNFYDNTGKLVRTANYGKKEDKPVM